MHESVLANEILFLFQDSHLKIFVDGTVGAGGHAALILQAHPEIECYYAFDRDASALAIAKETLRSYEDRVKWVHSPYSQLSNYVNTCDGILLDIGVSSMQLDQAERGFSFQREGPLDMRMDQMSERDASWIVNHYPEKKLGEVFKEYGEERRWRQAAKIICEARKKKPIKTTLHLVAVLEPVIGRAKGPIHPATRIFQALRMEVNQELAELMQGIDSACGVLNPKGRIAVISFHSLEDRLVKHRLKEKVDMKVITKKPITASLEELKKNRRARSAKLRCAEKIIPFAI